MKNLIKKILREEINNSKKSNIFSSTHVARHIFNLLSDEQREDWEFNDYHNVVKHYGKRYKLITINPNELKFNEDFDTDTVEEYKDMIVKGEKTPPIVIDGRNEIIDGNHRAQAHLLLNKNIEAYKPIEKKEKI